MCANVLKRWESLKEKKEKKIKAILWFPYWSKSFSFCFRSFRFDTRRLVQRLKRLQVCYSAISMLLLFSTDFVVTQQCLDYCYYCYFLTLLSEESCNIRCRAIHSREEAAVESVGFVFATGGENVLLLYRTLHLWPCTKSCNVSQIRTVGHIYTRSGLICETLGFPAVTWTITVFLPLRKHTLSVA